MIDRIAISHSAFRLQHCLLLYVALLAGCSAASSAASHPAPATRTLATRPATSPIVPVAYMSDGTGKPASITEAQREQLLEYARRVRPESAIWFVLVTKSDQRADYYIVAEVYFAPETQTPQLRRGTWIKLFATQRGEGTFDPEDVRFRQYAQVTPRDHPFSLSLDAPQAGIYLPFEPAWPPEKDLQQIPLIQAFYDAVSQYPRGKSELDQRITHFSHGDGKAEVNYGYGETTGSFLRFAPQMDGSFRLAGEGTWAMP